VTEIGANSVTPEIGDTIPIQENWVASPNSGNRVTEFRPILLNWVASPN